MNHHVKKSSSVGFNLNPQELVSHSDENSLEKVQKIIFLKKKNCKKSIFFLFKTFINRFMIGLKKELTFI